MLYPARFGGYTELYAGWSPEITLEKNAHYVIPWGRTGTIRPDIEASMKTDDGVSAKFWEWCDKETSTYA
jgi:retinol dehydrogenase 12